MQVWSYRDNLLKNYHSTLKGSAKAFHPKCLLIVGDLQNEYLNEDQIRSFELFRNGLAQTVVMTFDALFAKVAATCDLIAAELHKACRPCGNAVYGGVGFDRPRDLE
jgi:hypothetical protein